MALADIESELVEEIPWQTCAVCHHLSLRDEEWGERLRRLLRNRGITFADLARKLDEDPDEPAIDRQTLSRHARGQCSARERLR